MLAHGQDKVRQKNLEDRVQLIRADAMSLPVASQSVHAATIAFGIRNVMRPDAACKELLRVLKPGGRLAILEFGVPQSRVFRPIYLWYFEHVLPRIGRAVSRHDAAYSYLPQSVGAFQFGEDFSAILRGAGFSQVRARPFMMGAVYLYTAVKDSAGPKVQGSEGLEIPAWALSP